MDSFFSFAAQFVDLGPEAQNALSEKLVYHQFAKGHLLLKPGAVCDHIYFVESGLTRTFYFKDGKEVTDWLSHENSIACSIVSFINRTPDRRGIETLEDSVLWSLQHADLEELYRKYHEVERMGRLIVSHGATLMQKRFDALHFSSARERYNNLMAENPALIQRTPLNHIASYLGISQETLSRMRAIKT